MGEYICEQLMRGNSLLCNRLLAFSQLMSSHSFFDPIICLLLSPFVFKYMVERKESSVSTQYHELEGVQPLLLTCLTSVFKGSNRLFMFDVNEYDFRFSRLYTFFLEGVTHSCRIFYSSSVMKENNEHSDKGLGSRDTNILIY